MSLLHYHNVKIKTLPTISVLSELEMSLTPDVERLFTPQILPKGAVLVCAQHIWSQAYVIERGILRMYFLRRDGREFNKNFHQEGALLLPVTQAMRCQPSLFYLAAVEPTTLWTAPAQAVIQALHAQGDWERLQRHLLARLLSDKLQREHDLLALDGATRYQQLLAQQPALCQRVPLGMLASYLGLTDVSLSRIRRHLHMNESSHPR